MELEALLVWSKKLKYVCLICLACAICVQSICWDPLAQSTHFAYFTLFDWVA